MKARRRLAPCLWTGAVFLLVTGGGQASADRGVAVCARAVGAVVRVHDTATGALIDTRRLIEMFTGTGAVPEQRIGIAVNAIRIGNYASAEQALLEVLALTRMTPDQEGELRWVLEQVRARRDIFGSDDQ